MPDIPPAENPSFTLRVGTTGSVMPYSYYVGTELAGYDIELAHRFAAWLGAKPEFAVFDFGGIVPEAEAGRIDCIMSNLFYSEERNEGIPFSDVLFEVEITAMVRDREQPASATANEALKQLEANHVKEIEEHESERITALKEKLEKRYKRKTAPEDKSDSESDIDKILEDESEPEDSKT